MSAAAAPFDVVVIGGGPAGLAAAATLARQGRSVALCEQRGGSTFRVGETLGAEVGPLLRELGAWDAMSETLGRDESYVLVAASWGSGELRERSSMLHPLGAGWHVDRARFDAALAAWARSSGVGVHEEAGRCRVTAAGDEYVVQTRRGATLRARRLVDASGRGAGATASVGGRRWLSCDRQVAVVARLTGTGERGPDAGLVLEAVEDGYWYSAPLADGSLIAVLSTDADVLCSLGRGRRERFARALSRTEHTAARAAGSSVMGLPLVFRADSGRLFPDRGPGWRAVGDAAMATDPLGGNGVARALRGALELCSTLDDPSFDAALAERRFGDYLDERARYYWLETRWPDAPFWARRRPVDPGGEPARWRDVPLTMAPGDLLVWAKAAPPSAEAWVPRTALDVVCGMLEQPAPAHRVMSRVKAVAPVGDRRLLVGLQWLLATGVLRGHR